MINKDPSRKKPGALLRIMIPVMILLAGISLGWILKSLVDSRNSLAFVSPTPAASPILNLTANETNPSATRTKTPELQKPNVPTSTMVTNSNNPLSTTTATLVLVIPTEPLITQTFLPTPNFGSTSNLPVPAQDFSILWDNPNPDLYASISRVQDIEALISFTQTDSKTEIILVTNQKAAEGQLADSYLIISTLSNWVLQMEDLIQQRPISLATFDSPDTIVSCHSETSYADLIKIAQGDLDAIRWQIVSNAACN
jgi:hypothetical protein